MGAWRDQDGYLVDQDTDDYTDPKPRSRRCVCDSSGTEMPGVCPGRDRCPYSGDEPSEEEQS